MPTKILWCYRFYYFEVIAVAGSGITVEQWNHTSIYHPMACQALPCLAMSSCISPIIHLLPSPSPPSSFFSLNPFHLRFIFHRHRQRNLRLLLLLKYYYYYPYRSGGGNSRCDRRNNCVSIVIIISCPSLYYERCGTYSYHYGTRWVPSTDFLWTLGSSL